MQTDRIVAALLTLLVIIAAGAVLNPDRDDFRCFLQLRRPRWLWGMALAVVVAATSSAAWVLLIP